MADPELRMNLAALKRVDPYAKEIVDSATHVALYTFEDNEWEKTNVEGALFVYSRAGEPYYSLLIMNRLNTNNLIEPVARGFELQLKEPFLLYRNARCHIYGIWFYDKDECVRVATKLTALAKDSTKPPNHIESVAHNHSQSQPQGQVDIFSMLSKAQNDYNSNKALISNKVDSHVPRAPDVTSQSVMDFFAKAGSGAVHLPPTPSTSGNIFGRPPASDAREGPMLLQRLMSNPVHSVEHIEKQQRSVTPQDSLLSSNGSVSIGSGAKKSFPAKPLALDKVLPIKNQGKSKNRHLDGLENGIESEINLMRISSPKTNSPLAHFLNQSADVSQVVSTFDDSALEHGVCAGVSNRGSTPQKPALMPPTMFTTSTEVVQRPEPLTRNQLLQAFNYLLKNDADFVNKLHEAYVRSFSELVS